MKSSTPSFRGMAPRLEPNLLPENASQSAINARLLTGDLEPWHRPGFVHALPEGPAVLTIVKTQDLSTLAAGDTQTYQVVVTNTGPAEAPGATITDTLPAGFTFVDCVIAYDGGASGPATATQAELLAGIVVTPWPIDAIVTLVITGTFDAAGDYVNEASVNNVTVVTDSVTTTVTEPDRIYFEVDFTDASSASNDTAYLNFGNNPSWGAYYSYPGFVESTFDARYQLKIGGWASKTLKCAINRLTGKVWFGFIGEGWFDRNGLPSDPSTDTNPHLSGYNGQVRLNLNYVASSSVGSAKLRTTLAEFLDPPPGGFAPFGGTVPILWDPAVSDARYVFSEGDLKVSISQVITPPDQAVAYVDRYGG